MTRTTDTQAHPATAGMVASSVEGGQSSGMTCRRCGQKKPVTEFSRRHPLRPNGQNPICLSCHGAAIAAGWEKALKARRTRPPQAPHPEMPSPRETDHEMLMMVVLGFNKQSEILAKCYGENSPQYAAKMTEAKETFERLFDLLRNADPSLAGESRPGNSELANTKQVVE